MLNRRCKKAPWRGLVSGKACVGLSIEQDAAAGASITVFPAGAAFAQGVSDSLLLEFQVVAAAVTWLYLIAIDIGFPCGIDVNFGHGAAIVSNRFIVASPRAFVAILHGPFLSVRLGMGLVAVMGFGHGAAGDTDRQQATEGDIEQSLFGFHFHLPVSNNCNG